MTEALHKPPGRLSLFFRTRIPILWATACYARALWKLAWDGLTPDASKSHAAFKNFSNEMAYLANAWPESTLGKHRSRVHFLRSFFSSHAATTMATASETVLSQEADAGWPERIVDLSKQALRSYESGLGEAWEKLYKRSGWTARLRQRERCARQATLHANLAVAKLAFSRGDISQNLEKAISEYDAALSMLKDDNLREMRGKIYASLGTLLLAYPTQARQTCSMRAREALVHAAADLSDFVCVKKRLNAMRPEFGPGTSFWKFLFIGLPKALRVSGPTLWNAAWRGVPTRALGEIILGNIIEKVYWSLGIACKNLGQMEKAREYFDIALDLFSRGSREHAEVLVHKGLSYLADKTGNEFQNVCLAQDCFKEAHAESESESIFAISYASLARTWFRPDFWARSTLARAAPGEREKVLAGRVRALRDVASIARADGREALVQDALISLGRAYVLREDFGRAYKSLMLAVRIAERQQRLTRSPRLQRFIASEKADIYDFVIRTSLQYISCGGTHDSDRRCRISRNAFNVAECGRTRFLQRELSDCSPLPNGASPVEFDSFLRLRRMWLESELQTIERETMIDRIVTVESASEATERQKLIRERYLAELDQIQEKFDPAYDPEVSVSPSRFAELHSMLQALSRPGDVALVEYHITDRNIIAFVLLPGLAAPLFLDIGITRDELDEVARHWSDGCRRSQADLLRPQPLHWEQGYLVQTLHRIRRAVEVPACAIDNWERETGRRISRLILVPHRFLHLVPLHAVPLPNGRLWGDIIPIQYAPSASTLFRLFCRSGSVTVTNRKAVAVAHSPSAGISGTPLSFHADEAKAVADVTGGQVIAGQEATAGRVCKAMRDAAYIHFACHGAYDSDNPLNSGLDLALDGETSSDLPAASANGRLTLARIVERVHLAQAPLVVLSACETGIPKVESADEYIGLPAGFFLAGARLVVSTLWPISDLATWLLMRTFAREIARGSNAATALGSAQRYLRQLRSEDVIRKICDASAAQNDKRRCEQISSISAWLEQAKPYPFRSPYWWAGFTVNGLDDSPRDALSSRSSADYETVCAQ